MLHGLLIVIPVACFFLPTWPHRRSQVECLGSWIEEHEHDGQVAPC